MTKDEALNLCDYLECNDASLEAQCKAAAFIREALAQLAQEPVAQWQKRHRLWTEGAWENAEEHDAKRWRDKAQDWEIRALYTTPQPRPWVGLTDEEFDEIWRMDLNNKDIMDKTITKLKELNT